MGLKYKILGLVFLFLAVIRLTFAAEEFSHFKRFKDLNFKLYTSKTVDKMYLPLWEIEELNKVHTNASNKVVLICPGILERPSLFEGVIETFLKNGFRVFLGESRALLKNPTRVIRLDDVMTLDLTAHIDTIESVVSNAETHLFGHSMGGMMILSSLSKYPSLESRVKAVTIAASPHRMDHMPRSVVKLAHFLSPVLKTVRTILPWKKEINIHLEIWNWLKWIKKMQPQVGNELERVLLEFSLYFLDGTILDAQNLSEKAKLELWKKNLAHLPLSLIDEFVRAAKTGRLLDYKGNELIHPEEIKTPIQIIRAEKDVFVPWSDSEELFNKVQSSVKRLLSVLGVGHVDVIAIDHHFKNMHETLYEKIVEFHRNYKEINRDKITLAMGSCNNSLGK